jgi:hypothetical protein
MKRVFFLVAFAIGFLILGSAGAPYFGNSDDQVMESGLPVYPGATPAPELREGDRGLRTVRLENTTVHELTAAKYVSGDAPEKVLIYYRGQLKSYGTVTQCGEGTNTEVSIQLGSRTLSNPEECDPADVGMHQVELKAGSPRDQRIVAVGSRDGGSEFTLVHVRAR